jgi:hypothetical protein
MPASAQRKPPTDLVTVEATLTAMSRVPTLKDLSTYTAGLMAFEWKVDKVVSGKLDDKSILVYHWSYIDRKPQPAASWKTGEQRKLTLRPWAEVADVKRLCLSEDIVPGRVKMLAFYDTAMGVGMPDAIARSQTGGKILADIRRQLGADPAKVLVVNGADCHGLNDLHLLYGGSGKGKAVSIGGAGTGFGQHVLGYRVAMAECANLEWAIQSGGADRPCGGFGGSGYADALVNLAGPAWPPLPGRGPAPGITGDSDVVVLSGVGRGDVESLGVLQNCIREYGRRGKGFMLDLEFRMDGQYLRAGRNDAVHERFLSWGKVYPNFLYFHLYDRSAVRASVKAGATVSCATIEKARVDLMAKGWPPKLIPWSADPPDAKPNSAALRGAVQAGSSGGTVVVGGAWIARVLAGASGLAAFADAGIAEAELVLRSAIAVGKRPKCVVWGIEPLMLTAPREETSIGALAGPAWPSVAPSGKPVNLATTPDGATTISLGPGTTVARGKGTWEFGLEYSLILEATLRELNRHQIGVVLVLAPNGASIPAVAYEGLAERLRAYTVIYDGVRFLDPAEIAGKADAQARSSIETHVSDPKRGVLKSGVPVREEAGLKRLLGIP